MKLSFGSRHYGSGVCARRSTLSNDSIGVWIVSRNAKDHINILLTDTKNTAEIYRELGDSIQVRVELGRFEQMLTSALKYYRQMKSIGFDGCEKTYSKWPRAGCNLICGANASGVYLKDIVSISAGDAPETHLISDYSEDEVSGILAAINYARENERELHQDNSVTRVDPTNLTPVVF